MIDAFYQGPRVTELVPRQGVPAVLKKQTFILDALEEDGGSAQRQAIQVNQLLIKNHHLLMFGAGHNHCRRFRVAWRVTRCFIQHLMWDL